MSRARILAWAPALAAMAAIWGLSALEVTVPLGADKAAHVVLYGALGAIVARASVLSWPRRSKVRTLAFALWVTALFGLLDEIHQARVPGRTAELSDLAADGLGALAGVLAVAALTLGAGLLEGLSVRGALARHEVLEGAAPSRAVER